MEETRNKKKRIGGLVGGLFGLAAAIVLVPLLFKSPSFNAELKRVAHELNKSCPVMVDNETRLDNAIALPCKVLQYNYTLINMSKDSMNLQLFNDYLRPQIINNIRTHPDLKSFRDNRVTMVYNYKDRNGVFITRIVVNPGQYSD
jgi:hypothetical protein